MLVLFTFLNTVNDSRTAHVWAEDGGPVLWETSAEYSTAEMDPFESNAPPRYGVHRFGTNFHSAKSGDPRVNAAKGAPAKSKALDRL